MPKHASDTVIAYVRLVDEQAEVWRPTRLKPLAGGTYAMVEEAPYGERWEFEAPAVVRCETRPVAGGQRLAVVALA